ncbi:MAG: ABC transporter permease [Spirochaetes bacterium]|uniref:ABC transporter permease n=1 Tax=Candidatus Avitreponema avistercoris TaxID=2840705 RepID=A0A9D9HGZ7_9SPIR|nr:ABC transporter permease [Candidatus Avitreponema avistercoris]
MNVLSGNKIKNVMSKYTTYVIFVVLFVLLGFLTGFDSWKLPSLQNLVIAESIRAFAALGVGVIIITRGIDLSIGYAVCLTASMAASLSQSVTYEAAMYPGVDFPLFLPVLVAVLVGMLVGAVNGSLVAYAKLPPFIATLGMMSLCRGAQLIYTNATVVGSVKNEYKAIAQGYIGPFPLLMIYVAIAALLVWVILRHTRLGANLYAIGGNPQAARVAGIDVEKGLLFAYTFAGAMYGVAGALQTSRLGLANSLTAVGMEMDAIAAVTIGGVSQSGGVGTMGGMICGVLTMGIITYGMNFLNINPYFQYIVKGSIIIVAVFFDMRKHSRKS